MTSGNSKLRRFRAPLQRLLADLDAVNARRRRHPRTPQRTSPLTNTRSWEARAHGADLVLLIVAALDEQQTLREFLELTRSLGMTPSSETHPEEIRVAQRHRRQIVGINVRNLQDPRSQQRDTYASPVRAPAQLGHRVAESTVSPASGNTRLRRCRCRCGVLIDKALGTLRRPRRKVPCVNSPKVPMTR